MSEAGIERVVARLDPAYARELTRELVEMGPHKVAGTDLEHRAAERICEEMKRIGLVGVVKEPFPVLVRDVSRGGTVTVRDGATFWAWPMPGSWGTGDAGISAPLVNVGHGLAEDYESGDLDVDGKIVLYRRRPEMEGHDGAFRSMPVIEAMTRGARAAVTYDDLAPDDAVRISVYLLGANDYEIRFPCLAVSAAVAWELRDVALTAGEVTVVSRIDDPVPGTSHNVLGTIPGLRYPDELVVLASHYDTWWSGAADSASGIGAILGIARAMLTDGVRPDRTIVFLAHGAEEQGRASYFDWLIGSNANIAENHPEWVGRTVTQFNVDCISSRPEDCFLDSTPELRRLLQSVSDASGGRATILTETSPANMLTNTDSAAYVMHGVPSANITYWPPEYWRYYHTHYDSIALVTEASLSHAMELWTRAALTAGTGSALSLSCADALAAIAAALNANRRFLTAAGRDASEVGRTAAAVHAAIAEAEALEALLAATSDDAAHAEARRAQLAALVLLNARTRVIGGSYGFHLFYDPDPYARDAASIEHALRALDAGDLDAARAALENVCAMRVAGRHLSRDAYAVYTERLWSRPDLWATRVQRHVDVWDAWARLRGGEEDGVAGMLEQRCDEAVEEHRRALYVVEEAVAAVQKSLAGAVAGLELAAREERRRGRRPPGLLPVNPLREALSQLGHDRLQRRPEFPLSREAVPEMVKHYL